MGTILDIKRLAVEFHTNDGVVKALNGVDLKLEEGTTLGLVGETGAGKTTLSKAVMRLIQCPPGKIVSGEILFEEKDLLRLSIKEMRKYRGSQGGDAENLRQTDLNDLAGPDDRPQSGDDGWRTNRRGCPHT